MTSVTAYFFFMYDKQLILLTIELERISSVRHSSTATTLSASISGAGPRQASAGEAAYLQRLVDKYGSDVEQMARDRKVLGLFIFRMETLMALVEPGAADGGPVEEEREEMLRNAIVIWTEVGVQCI
jgi:hypothetical protein